MPRVVIVQRRLTHYRIPLFELLRSYLYDEGIQLELLVGKERDSEKTKNDGGTISWAIQVPCYYFLGERLCWQSIHKHLSGSDLVVVTQENALLTNHLLILQSREYKLAFWGHGANLQSDNPNGFKERFKRWTTNRVDWWFAYTQMSASLVNAAGFPANRITLLNNAVDTTEMQNQWQSVAPDEMRTLRESIGFAEGPVGVFVGSLHADKRLDFLFAAAVAIRLRIPDFHLLIVGDGRERDKVRAWCAEHQWARWVGARFGREKIAYISMAQIMLNPGLVGLGILDSFVCGVPMLTTDCGIHSPEIAYLMNGTNGVMTADRQDAYAHACVDLLQDDHVLELLRLGCIASASEYTVDNMARWFTAGIKKTISVNRR